MPPASREHCSTATPNYAKRSTGSAITTNPACRASLPRRTPRHPAHRNPDPPQRQPRPTNTPRGHPRRRTRRHTTTPTLTPPRQRHVTDRNRPQTHAPKRTPPDNHEHQDPPHHPHRLRLQITRSPHRPRHAQPRRPQTRAPRPELTHGIVRRA